MKRQIPGCKPGILPGVGHGDDVGRIEMRPLAVAAMLAPGWRWRLGWVAGQPFADIVAVELLRPKHTGECLALDRALVLIQGWRLERGVECVGLGLPLDENRVEIFEDDRRPTTDDRHRAI